MAAFASHVVAQARHADRAARRSGSGLIPGAGGTVSLTRRIGRQRTAALGLTGRTIDAATALRWGLVDEITLISASPFDLCQPTSCASGIC